jgi:hypothetical protein
VTRLIGETVRVVCEPVLLLPAGQVEPLAEVAAPVDEADADQQQRLVARLLDDVAREDAEAARVDRKRHVKAELRAEERHRTRDARSRSRRALEVCLDPRRKGGDPRHQPFVALDRQLGRRPQVGQEPDGVLP